MKRRQLFSPIWGIVIVLVLAHAAAATLPGLVGYWTFDEGQGKTASDSSGNGLHGTLNGGPRWVEGHLGGALDFDGVDDFVEVPHNSLLSLTKEITIAAWTNMRLTASGEMAIVSKGGWGANDLPYEVTETPGDVIFWQFYNDAGRDSCSPDSPPVGEWHHITATYDGKVFKCYIDGTVAEEWAYAGTMPKNTASVTIGRRSRGGTFFNGMIDDVAIYDRALSEEEIQSIMEGHLREEPRANNPSPRNGAVLEQTWTKLKWRAGDFAQAHEVYFGDSLEKVTAATPADTAVFVGRQTAVELSVGSPTGLVPGQTYYWRVDEINDSKPDSPWKGNVWSFRVQPVTAWNPWPLDGMPYVDPDQDLSWQKGMGTMFHQIFLGDSFEQVSSAVAPTSMSVDATYEPGTLQLDKTYYWRIDESTGMAARKGPVWSFTTRGSGGGVQAQYFNGLDLAGDPVLTQTETTIDHPWGDGEVAAGLSDLVSARWTADLQVPVSESYRLITTTDDGVRLWLDRLQVIENWTDHGTTDDSFKVNLVAGQRYFIAMEYYENTGGAVAQLSWESPSVARQIIPQGWLQLPWWAVAPYPAAGAVNTPQELLLQWQAGEKAAQHDVYFGQDAAAVASADPTSSLYQGRQADASFDPGSLEWGQTYYWRVDEIDTTDAASPWKGAVWSFTTAAFLVVEDFEIYTDEEGNCIYETWIDGFASGDNGSMVGYINPPFAEQTNVHGGRLAMPLDYNNVNDPYYSQAQRTWDTAQNWTANGGNTLVLYFRGNPSNGAEKLYVTLQDSSKTATVVHPDAAAAQSTQWTEWQIPLANFAGVSGTKIKSMIIGLGDRASPKKGGAGLLLLDDIRVIKPQ